MSAVSILFLNATRTEIFLFFLYFIFIFPPLDMLTLSYCSYMVLFFLSVKNKYYKRKFPRSTQDVDKRLPKQKKHETNPKPYLHPNHVRKSKTEFVLSLLYRLAQVYKLETKLILILWAEVTSFSNANLFLACQRVQNRHKGAAVHIFFPLLSYGDSLPS